MSGDISLHIRYQNTSNHQRLDSSRRFSSESVQTILISVCVILSVMVLLLCICLVWIYIGLVSLETQVWELKLTRCQVQFAKVDATITNHPEPSVDVHLQPPRAMSLRRGPSAVVKDEKNYLRPSSTSAHTASSTILGRVRLRSRNSNVPTRLSRDRRADSDKSNPANIGFGLQRNRRQEDRETAHNDGISQWICRGTRRRKNRLRIANFEGTFSQKTYNEMERYREPECITRTEWMPNKEIKGCRNQTFIIPSEGTALPFYTPEIKPKRKRELITHYSGDFIVNIIGSYLIHFNITVVDASETHFLALYVNDRAMLVCPNGGFRCPHANEPDVNRYRICNIGGVLELRVDDVVQIRTMAPNMMVRLEADQKSYFRFVYLGK